MEPVSPVVAGIPEVVYAKDQPQYKPLPSIRNIEPQEVPVTSRWKFTTEERRMVAEGADLYLTALTFGYSLQPVIVQVLEEASAREVLGSQGSLPSEG